MRIKNITDCPYCGADIEEICNMINIGKIQQCPECGEDIRVELRYDIVIP